MEILERPRKETPIELGLVEYCFGTELHHCCTLDETIFLT